MPVEDIKQGLWFYVFEHKGRRYFDYGFKSEAAAIAAENKKRIELSPIVTVKIPRIQLDLIIKALYDAANKTDIVFPSLKKPLRDSYEALSGKRFRADHDWSGTPLWRSGEDVHSARTKLDVVYRKRRAHR